MVLFFVCVAIVNNVICSTLDVGGTTFKASKTTLTSSFGEDTDHFLSRMFGGDWKNQTDDKGAIWIDRDPTYFQYILNYLRSGGKPPLTESMKELKSLSIEADFYGLTGLQKKIQLKMEYVRRKQILIFESDSLKKCIEKLISLKHFCLLYFSIFNTQNRRWHHFYEDVENMVVKVTSRIGDIERILLEDHSEIEEDVLNSSFLRGKVQHFEEQFTYCSDTLNCFTPVQGDPDGVPKFLSRREKAILEVIQIDHELGLLSKVLSK